jgi:hypothetical protein
MKTFKFTRISVALAALCTALVAAPVPDASAVTYPAQVRVCVENSTQLMRFKATCDTATETRESWSASAITPLVRAVCMQSNGTMGYSSDQRCISGTKLNFTVRGQRSQYIYACVQARTKLLKRVMQPERCSGRVLRWLITKQEPGTCANRGAVCAVGDVGPGGGIVFFVDSTDDYDFTYLEAAKSNWYQGGDKAVYTGCPRRFGRLVNDTPTAIGTGEATTQQLFGYCEMNLGYAGQPGFAPNDVTSYNYQGLTDWFIPSWDEVQELINANDSHPINLSTEPYASYCTTKVVLTTSGGTPSNDYYVAYLDGSGGMTSTGGQCLLRPIRAE